MAIRTLLGNIESTLSPSTSVGIAMCPNGVRRHFHLQPMRYLMGIKADGCPHPEKRNVIVFYFLVQSPDGNAEQPGQLLDRESLLLGAQLLNESHLDECLRESGKRRAGKAAMANLAALLFTNLSPPSGPVQ
jgi:hypothetical protein